MLSVHRFQSAICSRRILSVKVKNYRQIFFTGGKWTGRGGSSRLQPRRAELTPAQSNLAPETNGRLFGPMLFTVGVFLSIKIFLHIIVMEPVVDCQVYRFIPQFSCYLGI